MFGGWRRSMMNYVCLIYIYKKRKKMANGAVAKYSKVKRYYFEKDAQVQQLQNTVAHQRMAVSRTVLDDNEYANRFGRLDGAIKDLAFSIRKDWKSLPPWLLGYVNDDAHTVGMKEMTAIGRAFMSRWLVEEIFQRHFHPALDPTFSQQLKSIENNLRHQHQHVTTSPSPNTTSSGSSSNGQGQPPVAAAEDKENAIAKISNWRRTTFDGLGDAILQGPAAQENRRDLTEQLVGRLVATLRTYLHEPPPVGMDTSARLIVENAVGIAEKIPLESRDVCVEYPLPGSPVDEKRMKIEAGVPPLTNVRPENIRRDHDDTHESQGQGPGQDIDPDDTASGKDRDTSAPPSPTVAPPAGQQGHTQGSSTGADTKKKSTTSVFSSLMGKRPPPSQPATPQPHSHSQSTSQQSQSQPPSKDPEPVSSDHKGSGSGPGSGSGSGRIRFAAFMDAEVQGKGPVNVLARAPVYLLE